MFTTALGWMMSVHKTLVSSVGGLPGGASHALATNFRDRANTAFVVWT